MTKPKRSDFRPHTLTCPGCGKQFVVSEYRALVNGRKYCSRDCCNAHRDYTPYYLPPLTERFWSKVDQSRDCWLWVAALNNKGYGQITINKRRHLAHRVAYELANGVAADFVLHKCDNRKCVNPGHLFSGTFDDNMADMVAKKRQAHGEKNSHAKLNAEKVKAIRSEVGLHREIGAKYGVTASLVSMIRSGRIWRNV